MAARRASLSFTVSWSLLRLMSTESRTPSSHLMLFRPLSSCPQSLPASGSLPVSQLFPSGGQSTGASASASVVPMNIQSWFPSVLTGLISLQSKGPLRVFPSAAVLSPRDVQLPQPCLLKGLSFFHWAAFSPLSGSAGQTCVNVFLGSLVYSVD